MIATEVPEVNGSDSAQKVAEQCIAEMRQQPEWRDLPPKKSRFIVGLINLAADVATDTGEDIPGVIEPHSGSDTPEAGTGQTGGSG